MRLSHGALWAPKAGNDVAGYEDRFSPRRRRPMLEVTDKRFAVADGASEGALSAQWAAMLVGAFAKGQGPLDPPRFFAKLIGRWPAVVQAYRDERERQGRPIQWYEHEALARGAYSTFLGVHLSCCGDERRWAAWAVGDSCLVQVRRGTPVAAFPREPGDAFHTAPPLVPSLPRSSGASLPKVEVASGLLQVEDTVLLVTDALADWLYDRVAEGEDWTQLLDFVGGAHRRFRRWIAHLRAQRLIRNDDVTVLRVDVEG